MDSATATPPPSTRLVLTRIPDSWAWMRPDLLVRLMPFAIAFGVAYAWSGGAGWLGRGAGNLDVELGFGAGGARTMFAGAAAVLVRVRRRRGPLRVRAGGVVAGFQAGVYVLDG